MKKHKRYLLGLASCLLAILAFTPLAWAAEGDTENQKAPVTQSYKASENVKKGMIVRLKPKDSTAVVSLSYENDNHMLGLVVASNEAALTLSQKSNDRQVYVATYGNYEVLVSNQNGVIETGDYIGISNLNGIGMKADARQDMVVGKALEGFNGTNDVIGTAELSTPDGPATVSLSRIAVSVNVRKNPLKTPGFPDRITRFLSALGYTVNDGQPVSPIRLYLALAVLFIAALVSGSLLFAAVRNAMVSIGRNPLAKSSIVKSMLQAVITSLIIFIIGIFAVYLLLKL